ncbi:MAG: cytochrome P450 [Sphingomonas sp.]
MTVLAASSERPLSLARLLDPAVRDDPFPFYREIADAGGVVWDPYLHTWLVTGYSDVVRVFQVGLSARTPSADTFGQMGLPMLAPAGEVLSRMMMFMDPPDHMKVRTACVATFTPRRVQQLRARMADLCADLLSTMIDEGEWNVLERFAEPLPAMITTDLIGLPIEDWPQLKRWSDRFADLIGNFHQSRDEAHEIAQALEEISDYLARAFAEQRRHPRDGMISMLLGTDGAPARLDDQQIMANVLISLVGGLGSTTHLINTGLAILIASPGAIAAMKRTPQAMASGIEELLRYESPSQFSGRIAPYDLELRGQRIGRGDAIMAMTAAANRDPAVFADPDRFDPLRSPNRHLAFAWGAHFCFGATLARLACAIAYEALFARVSSLRFADRPREWRDNLSLRGLRALWVVPTLSTESLHASNG